MSTPFAVFLRSLRLRAALSQTELAQKLGYEQAYLSALELGVKPPSTEFLTRLRDCLSLTDADHEEMERELRDSPRRFAIPADLPTEEYRLYAELQRKVGRLLPTQIATLRAIVRMDEEMAARPRYGAPRVRRKSKEDVEM
ncbi:helix-turn-helix domain-containing protein (plasmid) [Burkholderia vietnamiensis]|uniref:helix-turn-helix domain-containing protein n=1 Tax=Burkholderia vietnamiensis TaxID=60552 RepID=UPI002019D56C|nr:helix-turn-helix domain-containing protein [Burkholderia vietnamiensis]MCO1348078.1 helix-turn-helix domain-containing protein [Burkholderia vietnamiensis]MCO1430551.1 helix-turn-helix domain-containing protein [Burkholderia vietnamiensis]UQN46411.1 helix-turn-helix domain-containing protein [Burkholderia vietnamiensis]